ncbi:MAG: hypothetical protein O7F13_04350, partial [Gammaproteobacteria bacterium]|nr:hypothetical protein [Gammaproteobacteria bacterium]
MKTALLIFSVATAVFLTWLFFSPVSISPSGWQPDPDPGMTGAFRRNDALAGVVRLTPGLGEGPEDIALGPSGLLYT